MIKLLSDPSGEMVSFDQSFNIVEGLAHWSHNIDEFPEVYLDDRLMDRPSEILTNIVSVGVLSLMEGNAWFHPSDPLGTVSLQESELFQEWLDGYDMVDVFYHLFQDLNTFSDH